MRNLKRALSLALALVMVLSMMVVGASAVSADDFSDSADIVNKEAVTVLATLGVITGNDDGSYAPADTISRAEMSTIICRVLNGGKDPVLGESVTNTYTDTASHWAKNYIEYCTTLGIIAGKGDGTFDPEGDVTVAEAAKMVLVALGYNAPMEGYTGANWQINVDARANPLGLYDDLTYTTTSAPLTRDNAAQMLYNALDCDMVKYSVVLDTTSSTVISTTQLEVTDETLLEDKFNAVKVEGVVIANEEANLEASASGNGTSLEAGKTKIQIDGEADQDFYLGTKTFSVSSSLDELGRYVAIYVKKENNSANAQVLGSVIVSEDNKVITDASSDDIETVADDNDLNLTANTLVAKNYQGLTELGSLSDDDGTAGVQKVLIDNDDDGDVDYVLLNTWYFGRVTTYVASGDGSIAIDVGATQRDQKFYDKSVTKLTADDKDDVVGFDDVAKDDYVLAQYIGGDLHVELAEAVTGNVESYKYNDAGTLITKVTVDGTEYNISNVTGYTGGDDDIRKAADDADEFVTNDASVYLDKNGYVVAIGEAEANAGKYAMVLAVGQNIEDRVKVALADGTIATYTLNDSGSTAVKKSALNIGQVYGYTINSNDEIRLTKVDLAAGDTEQGNATFKKGKITITSDGGTYYASSNTAFFYVNDGDGKIIDSNHDHSILNEDVDTYASYTSAPDLAAGATATVYTKGTGSDKRVVAVVFAGLNLASADVSDNLYIANIVSTNGDETTVTAYVNGSDQPQTITIDDTGLIRRTTWTYSVNPDGTYTLDSEFTRDNWTVIRVTGNNFVVRDDRGNETTYAITADTVIVDDSKYLDAITATLGTSGTVSEGDNIIGLVDDDNDALMVVVRNEKVSSGGGSTPGTGPVTNGDATLSSEVTGVTPQSIRLASRTGNFDFSFKVADEDKNKTINYTYSVYLNDEWQGDVSGSAAADANGRVSVADTTSLNGYYTSGDEVEIVITAAKAEDYVQPPVGNSNSAEEIQNALDQAAIYGETVTLTGPVTPDAAIEIPDGATLKVEGDFTNTNGVTGEGTLVVEGAYKAANATTVAGTLTTQTIASDSAALNITGTLELTDDATLPAGSTIEGTVNVAEGKTLTLNDATLSIDGVVNAESATVAVSDDVAIGAEGSVTVETLTVSAQKSVNNEGTLVVESFPGTDNNIYSTAGSSLNVGGEQLIGGSDPLFTLEGANAEFHVANGAATGLRYDVGAVDAAESDDEEVSATLNRDLTMSSNPGYVKALWIRHGADLTVAPGVTLTIGDDCQIRLRNEFCEINGVEVDGSSTGTGITVTDGKITSSDDTAMRANGTVVLNGVEAVAP